MSRAVRLAAGIPAAFAALAGLAAAGVRTAATRPAAPLAATPRPATAALPPAAPAPRGIRIAQRALIALGVLLLVTAAVFDVTVARPSQLPGLLVWMAAAVVLHDAVLSPLALVADLIARRAGRRLPPAALAVAQVAVVVGVVLTAVIAPAIRAKQLGTSNASVLPLDYGAALAGTLSVLALAALLALLAGALTRRRATS